VKNEFITLSDEILALAKAGEDTASLRRQLFFIRQAKLEKSLYADDLKKTFWINIYIAFFLIISKETKDSNRILNIKRIKICRNLISLNDIQHGILRKSRFKIGFGYIPNPFYSTFIKSVAVDKVDYRIHFALGSITVKSISVPIYDSKEIDRQLSIVTQIFLHLKTEFDHDSKTIQVSDFILHNLKDFGGKKSVIQIMENIFKKDFSAYRLRFKTDNLINTIEHSF
jgi:hypothetical protein